MKSIALLRGEMCCLFIIDNKSNGLGKIIKQITFDINGLHLFYSVYQAFIFLRFFCSPACKDLNVISVVKICPKLYRHFMSKIVFGFWTL